MDEYVPRITQHGFVLFCALLAGILFNFGIKDAFAQFSIEGALGQASAALVSNPQYPGPFTSVTISLDDYSVNAVGARIAWYLDGKEQTESANKRSIELETGAVGKKMVVKVVLTQANGSSLSATKTISPMAVDIVLEAQTYIPLFYTGKPLPSSEASMRAIALVYDGSGLSPDSYTYLWTLDTTVLQGGALRGGYIHEFTMPRYKNKILSVQVLNTKSETVGKGSVVLNAVEPELLFYEHSPLRGLATKTLVDPYPLIGEETTIYGEPYFVHVPELGDELSFTWTIDGKKVDSDFTAINALSLKRVGESGEAQVAASVITKRPIPQSLTKSFDLFFNTP